MGLKNVAQVEEFIRADLEAMSGNLEQVRRNLAAARQQVMVIEKQEAELQSLIERWQGTLTDDTPEPES